MSNIAITETDLVKFRTATDYATAAATSTAANTAETFEFDSLGGPFIVLATVANSHGSVSLALTKGDGWAGQAISIGDAVQNKVTAFLVEPAYGMQDTGKIEIKATPANGKKLLTDHALTLGVIQISL